MSDTVTIVLGDTHGAFAWYEGLEQIIAQEPDIDHFVVAGDITDSQSISRFADLKKVPLEDDFEAARFAVQYLADRAPVILVRGNHDKRVEKWVATHLPQDYQFLMKTDILQMIGEGIPGVTVGGIRVTPNDGLSIGLAWVHQQGDCLIGHAESSSGVTLRSVQAFYNWTQAWGPALGLGLVRTVIQGHTHRMGTCYERGGAVQLIECGCMMRTAGMGYAIESGNVNYKPIMRGYVRLVQDQNGKTDHQRTIAVPVGVPTLHQTEYAPTAVSLCTPAKAAVSASAAGTVPAEGTGESNGRAIHLHSRAGVLV